MVTFEGSWSPKSGPNRFICSRRSFLAKGRFIAVRSNCATVEKVISTKMFWVIVLPLQLEGCKKIVRKDHVQFVKLSPVPWVQRIFQRFLSKNASIEFTASVSSSKRIAKASCLDFFFKNYAFRFGHCPCPTEMSTASSSADAVRLDSLRFPARLWPEYVQLYNHFVPLISCFGVAESLPPRRCGILEKMKGSLSVMKWVITDCHPLRRRLRKT